MAKETGTEQQIPKGHRWDDLEALTAPGRFEAYKKSLIDLGMQGSRLVTDRYSRAGSRANR